MSPFITRGAYAVFKSELVYTIIVCAGFYLWLNTDSAKENIIVTWLPYFKTINVIVIYICAVLAAKKVIDIRSGVKKVIEKGDLEEKEHDE